MNLALYRKFRPSTFEDLVGQDSISHTLLNALQHQKWVHAYLFSGPRGTGKTSTARLIAKAIQCENRQENGAACNACSVCEMHQRGDLVDLVEIDAASNRGIDEIRDLKEKIRFSPSYAKSKVYIIDEVHMLTKEAFNALLKSLEEPPEHVIFILATTELHKIPETILSRCQRYEFKRIDLKTMTDRLNQVATLEGMSVEAEALEILAKYADGGMRDALSLLEQFSGSTVTVAAVTERLGLAQHQAAEALFAALENNKTKDALLLIENLHQEGRDLGQFSLHFLELLRSKLHAAVQGNDSKSIQKTIQWVELFDEAWVKLKRASISQLPLEIAVIRATHPVAVAVAEIPSSAPIKRPEGLAMPTKDSSKAPQDLLQKVAQAIQTSAVKQSFLAGSLDKIENGKIHMHFTTQFHWEKVHAPSAMSEIEEAFKKVKGEDLKFFPELRQAALVSENAGVESLGWETVEEPI